VFIIINVIKRINSFSRVEDSMEINSLLITIENTKTEDVLLKAFEAIQENQEMKLDNHVSEIVNIRILNIVSKCPILPITINIIDTDNQN